jgi:long-chain acyl-CoA synthetase
MIESIFKVPEQSIAVLDEAESRPVSYGELRSLVESASATLAKVPRPGLLFHLCPNSLGGLITYLAALHSKLPLCLLDPRANSNERLLQVYQPTLLALPCGEKAPDGFIADDLIAGARIQLWSSCRANASQCAINPDLALMLTTSGSTGNPKVVRLSQANICANAASIAAYLGLGPGEISIQSLPTHYSYGLSLVNSHLFAGGTVALTNHSFMRPEFWGFFKQVKASSFAGVPYMYETMQKLRLWPTLQPSLRTMTQAGGNLRPDVIKLFHEAAHKANKRFFVMYGQTEATARISYVPWDRLGEKIGTIGVPIPNGRLSLRPIEESGHNELIYEGPNVMLGYAQSREDLALGDQLQGRLATGDLAEMDTAGFFRITGRLARFAKLFGKRVQLSDLETKLGDLYGHPCAAVEGHDALRIFCENLGDAELASGRHILAEMLGVPPSSLHLLLIDSIPRLVSGKIDYQSLEK